VTQTDCGYSWDEIEISLAFVIEKILPMAVMNEQWFFVIVEIKLGHIFVSIFQYLLIGSALIWRWCEIAMGQRCERVKLFGEAPAYHIFKWFSFVIKNNWIINFILKER
jgi:hypothetical protein